MQQTGIVIWPEIHSSFIAGRHRLREIDDQVSVAKRVFPTLSRPGPRFSRSHTSWSRFLE